MSSMSMVDLLFASRASNGTCPLIMSSYKSCLAWLFLHIIFGSGRGFFFVDFWCLVCRHCHHCHHCPQLRVNVHPPPHVLVPCSCGEDSACCALFCDQTCHRMGTVASLAHLKVMSVPCSNDRTCMYYAWTVELSCHKRKPSRVVGTGDTVEKLSRDRLKFSL